MNTWADLQKLLARIERNAAGPAPRKPRPAAPPKRKPRAVRRKAAPFVRSPRVSRIEPAQPVSPSRPIVRTPAPRPLVHLPIGVSSQRWVSPPATEGIPSARDEATRPFGFGVGGSSSLLKAAILRRELEQAEAIIETKPAELEVCRFCGAGVNGGAESCTKCHRKNFRNIRGAARVSTSKEIAFVGPDPINLAHSHVVRRPGVPPPSHPEGSMTDLRLVPPLRWQRQCTAVDAETGKRCTLLEHGPELLHSASGRTFKNPLAAGAEPRRELDLYAQQRSASPIDESDTGQRDAVVRAAHQREYAKRRVEREAAVAAAIAKALP